jgi:hypothetical protein
MCCPASPSSLWQHRRATRGIREITAYSIPPAPWPSRELAWRLEVLWALIAGGIDQSNLIEWMRA